jgi:hypothetical protein
MVGILITKEKTMKKRFIAIASKTIVIISALIFISPPLINPEIMQWMQEERARQEYQRQQNLQWQQQQQALQWQQQNQSLQFQQMERMRQLEQQNQLLQWQMQERARQFPPRPWP